MCGLFIYFLFVFILILNLLLYIYFFKSLARHVWQIKWNGDTFKETCGRGETKVEPLSTFGTWLKRFTPLNLAKKTLEIRAVFWECCRSLPLKKDYLRNVKGRFYQH